VTDNGASPAAVTPGNRWTPRQQAWLSVGAVLLVVLLGALALGVAATEPRPEGGLATRLPPASELDRRWGTYLSEREWGTPREALGADGWGLSWRGAIDTDYRYSDDGIAGITDSANEFRFGWAFWDGSQPHVSERLYGANSPQGEAGEQIIDDRVFHENTPSHAYSRLSYRYPPLAGNGSRTAQRAFEIELESAKLDSQRLVMSATVTNNSAQTRELDVVFKAWLAPLMEVEPIDGGLLLRGGETVVAVVGSAPTSWQISAAKDALDLNLRAGALAGDEGGHIGALAYHLAIEAEATRTLRFALVETPADEAAVTAARSTLDQAAAVVAARQAEARRLFIGDVAQHGPLYQQALMSLLWNESFYRWDGASGLSPEWAGRVDARDVLIVPDKWEFPWPASWDSAFHALTASLIDPELAAAQLRLLLSERWQQPDGHIPCSEWVMAQECPPIFAWAAWRIYQVSRDRTFLTDVYPALQRHYDYWWQAHGVEGALFHAGFLGMDNLPRSARRAQADASAWMAFFARDMARIASELHDGPASERYWTDRGRIQDAINEQLWDEETGFYYDLGRDGGFVRHKSYSGLVPLIAGVVPAGRIPAILAALHDEAQLLSPAGIRSLSADSPLYLPATAGQGINSNWRGPVWVPLNYLLIEALAEVDPSFADDLRGRLVGAVERDWQASGRFHEFFDGDTGAGLGADAQSWTMVVANLIAEGWPAR
jgi:hypothetical protein